MRYLVFNILSKPESRPAAGGVSSERISRYNFVRFTVHGKLKVKGFLLVNTKAKISITFEDMNIRGDPFLLIQGFGDSSGQ